MVSSEVFESVQKAVRELELGLEAYLKKNPREAELRVWNASSEAEYALFLLEVEEGLSFQEGDSPKNKVEGKNPVELVVKAQNLLKEALEAGENSRNLFEKLWEARKSLITLQEGSGGPGA